jgi:hypothetical protein
MQLGQLEQTYYGEEVYDRFYILVIVNGSHSRNQRKHSRHQGSTSCPGALVAVSGQALNASHDAVLAVGVSFYAMVARRAQRTTTTGALNSSNARRVVRTVHSHILESTSTCLIDLMGLNELRLTLVQ